MKKYFPLAFLGATTLFASAAVTQPTPYIMVDFNSEATVTKATIGKDVTFVNTGVDKDGIEWEADPITFFNDGKGVTATDGYVLVPDGAYIHLDISDLPGFTNPQDPENPYVGTYSVFWDIKVSKLGTYYCLLQTNPGNSTDAKLCINGSGKLGSGFLQRYNSDWTAEVDTWYRVGATFHQPDGLYALYVNGKCIEDGTSGNVSNIGGRFALEKEGLLFFADEDGEDSPIYCSKAMFFDRDLSMEEVATLGDPKTEITASSGVADVVANNGICINVDNAAKAVTVNVADGIAEVNIYNVTGVKVNEAAVEGSYTWSYTGAAPGVYVVSVNQNGKKATKKLIVK